MPPPGGGQHVSAPTGSGSHPPGGHAPTFCLSLPFWGERVGTNPSLYPKGFGRAPYARGQEVPGEETAGSLAGSQNLPRHEDQWAVELRSSLRGPERGRVGWPMSVTHSAAGLTLGSRGDLSPGLGQQHHHGDLCPAPGGPVPPGAAWRKPSPTLVSRRRPTGSDQRGVSAPHPPCPEPGPLPHFQSGLKTEVAEQVELALGKEAAALTSALRLDPAPQMMGWLWGAAGDQEFWVGWPPTTCPACACPGTGLGLCRTF